MQFKDFAVHSLQDASLAVSQTASQQCLTSRTVLYFCPLHDSDLGTEKGYGLSSGRSSQRLDPIFSIPFSFLSQLGLGGVGTDRPDIPHVQGSHRVPLRNTRCTLMIKVESLHITQPVFLNHGITRIRNIKARDNYVDPWASIRSDKLINLTQPIEQHNLGFPPNVKIHTNCTILQQLVQSLFNS